MFRLLWIPMLGLVGLACKPDAAPPLPAVSCRLVSETNSLIESTQQLTEQLTWTFGYGADKTLTSLTAHSPTLSKTFQLRRSGGQLTQLTADKQVLAITYGPNNMPTSATVTDGGTLKTTFAVETDALGFPTRITETRAVLPDHSLIRQRSYTFATDNQGSVTTETASYSFTTGVVAQLQTRYVADKNASPYISVEQRAVLTLVGLMLDVEPLPGRFWQAQNLKSYTSYFLNANGGRASLSDSTVYTNTFDADNKLTGREQLMLQYQLSVPTPVTRNFRQSYTYSCP